MYCLHLGPLADLTPSLREIGQEWHQNLHVLLYSSFLVYVLQAFLANNKCAEWNITLIINLAIQADSTT